MNNGKKEFARNGFEADYLSRNARRVHSKKLGIAKYVKKKVNKRFRADSKIDKNKLDE